MFNNIKKDLGRYQQPVIDSEIIDELTYQLQTRSHEREILELLEHPCIKDIPQKAFENCLKTLAKCQKHRTQDLKVLHRLSLQTQRTLKRMLIEGLRITKIKDAWINIVNEVLLEAIYDNNINVAIFALDNGAHPNGLYVNLLTRKITNQDDRPHGSFLMIACSIGFTRMVQALIYYGVR